VARSGDRSTTVFSESCKVIQSRQMRSNGMIFNVSEAKANLSQRGHSDSGVSEGYAAGAVGSAIALGKVDRTG